MLCHNSVDNDDEGCGRSANLHAASAEHRDEKSGNNRSVKTLHRLHAGSNRQGDGQRQRDNCNDDSGDDIPNELFSGVALQGIKDFWF